MNKGLAILAAAALFASGLAIGGLGVHLVYSQKIVERGAPPMPMGPMFERWLGHRLDLDGDQKARIKAILRQSAAEAEQLRTEMGPPLRDLNRRMIEEISEVLTPEQRQEFREFLNRRERRHRGFGRGPGSRGGGPRGRRGSPPL